MRNPIPTCHVVLLFTIVGVLWGSENIGQLIGIILVTLNYLVTQIILIRKLFHKRKRLWKKAKSTQLDIDLNKDKSLRNKVKSKLNKSYYQHVHSLINSKNPKRFWSFIKSKTKSKSIPVTMKWSDRGVTASTGKDKAELFCKFFASVFTCPDPATDVDEDAHLHGSGSDILDLMCSSANVGELLLTLDVNKATGPDGLSARLLREAAPVISDPLSKLFNMSLNRGKLPRDWKCANITPVYKNGGKEYVSNYRPISLTSLVVKTLEKLVTRHIMAHLEDHDLLSPHQYGFRAGFSCTSQLIRLFHSWASALDKNKTSDVVFLDFKCKCMRITRSRSVTPCSYNINSIPLEQVKTHKHLGVIISSDLSWKPHVLSVAAKANKILGLLKRTFGKCSEAITIGYKSMVRPIVEYACPVWNPHQQLLLFRQMKLL